ncbi:MAG: hypothetical protein ACYC1M_16100 [Armatimonadota bacterium]
MPLVKVKRNLLLIALVLGLAHAVYLGAGLVIGKSNQEVTLMPGGVDIALYIMIMLFIPITIAVLKVQTASALDYVKSGGEGHDKMARAVIYSGVVGQIPTLICLLHVMLGYTPDPLYISVTIGSVVTLLEIVPEIEHYVKDAYGLLPPE